MADVPKEREKDIEKGGDKGTEAADKARVLFFRECEDSGKTAVPARGKAAAWIEESLDKNGLYVVTDRDREQGLRRIVQNALLGDHYCAPDFKPGRDKIDAHLKVIEVVDKDGNRKTLVPPYTLVAGMKLDLHMDNLPTPKKK
jgi:hypothetical protein